MAESVSFGQFGHLRALEGTYGQFGQFCGEGGVSVVWAVCYYVCN